MRDREKESCLLSELRQAEQLKFDLFEVIGRPNLEIIWAMTRKDDPGENATDGLRCIHQIK